VRATDLAALRRCFAAGAASVALAIAGCSLNPQPDDPGLESSNQGPSGGSAGSGAGGSTSFGGFPSQNPPSPGAGGSVAGIADAASPPTTRPVEAGADGSSSDRDGAPIDAGDAMPDRHASPTRD
jgi:hypothetical protein